MLKIRVSSLCSASLQQPLQRARILYFLLFKNFFKLYSFWLPVWHVGLSRSLTRDRTHASYTGHVES